MTESFIPQLTTFDWGEEWKNLQKARRAADDPTHWDERSKTYGCADPNSPYVRAFVEFAQIRPGETVLDMGCGTGAIALPLAAAGCNVIAADFSRGMLGVLEETARARGIALGPIKKAQDCQNAKDATDSAAAEGRPAAVENIPTGVEDRQTAAEDVPTDIEDRHATAEDVPTGTVETKVMNWEDDWSAFGIEEDSVDVAVSSRSIATADLRDSLERLTRVARRRVCITLAAGSSPRTDERILSAIGLQNRLGRDFVYAFMILAQMGYHPEVRYIPSARRDTYDSHKEAFENLRKMVVDAAGSMTPPDEVEKALGNLDAWLRRNLVANEHVGETDEDGKVQKALRLNDPRIVNWAFLAWDK